MKIKILNSKGLVEPCCCSCQATTDLRYGPDPFALEIYDDYTEVWLCDNCYQNHCDDI